MFVFLFVIALRYKINNELKIPKQILFNNVGIETYIRNLL